MFRAIAYILLLFSLVALTGLGATASALVHQDSTESCCDHREEGESDRGQDEPCSASECSCPFCLFLDRPDSLSLSFLRTPSKFSYGPLQTICSSAYIRLIEYPPETA